MSYIAEDILLCYQTDNEVVKDILMHYGTKRHSGRYPWGSGDNPYQHEIDFRNRVLKLRSKGMSELEIAKKCGYSNTSELRAALRAANNNIHAYRIKWGKALLADGLTPAEAARRMGIPDSSFRALMDEQAVARAGVAQKTADILKAIVDEKGPIDIGAEVNREIDINGTGIGISKEKLMQAVDILKKEGYEVRVGSMPQVTDEHGQRTTMKVLCPPGTPKNAAYDYEHISSLIDYGKEYYSRDDGETLSKFQYPASLDGKRVYIRYGEENGGDLEGLIQIRRGVPDISLGNSHYAQVRILVDGDKYMKGMAAYSDDIPDGYDVVYNTKHSRSEGNPMKPIKEDPLNPFGAYIGPKGQSTYIGKDGKEHLSVINKTRDEGEWNEWSKTLPSQFLSKQNKKLIENQLALSIADKYSEYEDICNLTNPTVKRRLLETFAEDCDATSVHLDAAALPRQRFQVILPVKSLKDTEVYAPNFKPGEKVALVRYPHGGIFEIPVLTVTDKNKEATSMIGKNGADAIGINAKVASQLSGADFDGDTVMVIPVSGKVNISHKPYLDALKNFDPHVEYPEVPGMQYMKRTDREMGVITNLIMDMTLMGAPDDEVARAVKHSMVVIDAKKHKLNYKLSEEENGIKELKDKYQGHYNEKGNWVYGSGTIITRAKSQTHVTKRRGEFSIDPDTGEKIWKEAYDAHYTDYKTGKPKTRTQQSYAMLDTDDPYSLISKYRTPQEEAYARYASQLKALANEARKEYKYHTPNLKYSPSAAEVYKDEVASLKEKLNRSRLNAPREREAQRRANVELERLFKLEPNLRDDKKERGKRAQQYLTQARLDVGAQRYKIEILPKEWEAIQAGAITDSLLRSILDATDTDKIREYATPRDDRGLSSAKKARLQALKRSGYTNAEIADALNVPVSTILYYMKNE